MSRWRFNYPEHPGLERWLNDGERGVSSNAIVQYLVHGKIPAGFNDPADPSDFRRCELLLKAVPSLRKQFHRMAEVSPRWAALVERWGEIAALLEEEYPTGKASRTFELMRNLGEEAA
ncbi:hypothetical protein [Zhihengliuella halotolerans]|uniref:hypothetical protein n=1 Tax=Zhihengliuella halotolerans TaxID=370736 RepID=UPI000C7FF504|nr:hypothetical protein [Zhihengliuella halotolerans]